MKQFFRRWWLRLLTGDGIAYSDAMITAIPPESGSAITSIVFNHTDAPTTFENVRVESVDGIGIRIPRWW